MQRKTVWNKGIKTGVVPSSAYKKQDIRVSGKNNWNWMGGKPKCKICSIEISYGKNYCKKHAGIARMGKYTSAKISHKEIIEKYLSGMSSIKISKIAQISPAGVLGILKRNEIKMGGIVRDRRYSNLLRRVCNYDAIINDYKSGMFLHDVAKKHNIGDSHTLHILKKNGIQSRGREGIKKGKDHPRWRGGKTHDKDGYIIQKEGRTHRLVMERIIGRKLFHWESVHHINGNKRDYDITNLVLMTGREHIRFHTFLRLAKLEITKDNLIRFCRKESDLIYHFTVKDFREVCLRLNIQLKSLNKNKRKVCRVKDCSGLNAGKGYCSKHYQRYVARKRGYWKSGGGKLSPFLGKFSKEKSAKINSRP